MSVMDHAASELKLAKIDPAKAEAILTSMRAFFDKYDSGGAVAAMAPTIDDPMMLRLVAFKPLAPLTGEEPEWFDPMGDGVTFQNIRCCSVFKEKDGDGNWITYDLDARPGRKVRSHRWADREITFPYNPVCNGVAWPMMEVETSR